MTFRMWAMIGTAAIVLFGMAWLYFDYSQTQIATLNQKIATQESAIKGLETSLDALKLDAARVAREQAALNDALTEVRVKAARAQQILDRHNLGELGARKPSLIETRVNRATRATKKRLEELTK